MRQGQIDEALPKIDVNEEIAENVLPAE